ncbi:IPT/TIG domain-containing protein [Mucilaginibacter sp. UYCu711]|uniref:IPT/TIG domain-containing protein n=1 Tax=Mucilaginibacter sp. UYCu711 TaxID=3156339 RepID=UPI003D1C970A
MIVLFAIACSKSGNDPKPDPTPTNPTNNPVTISSLSVTSGEASTTVIVNGTNFSTTISANQVLFNGTVAIVTAASTTQLTVKVPQDASSGAVTVTVNGGATVTGPVFTFIGPVKITSIDVNKGTDGAVVKITGAGFSTTLTDNKVLFNNKPASITAATATLLTVTVPVNPGTGAITVSVGSGSPVTGPTFTYVEFLKITSTDVTKGIAGATVNITGTGFSTSITDNKLFFNGIAATVSSATTTLLSVKVPQGCGVGKLSISVGGQSFEGPSFDYYLSTTVTTLAGNIPAFADGTGTAANFEYIKGIAIDNVGNIYVTDYDNHRIRKITPSGVVTTLAGIGISNTSPVQNPYCITVDKDGNVYFTGSARGVQKITPAGVVSTYAGDSGSTYIANPSFNAISGLATDANGNVYVADENSAIPTALIRKISSNGVTTIAGNGRGTAVDGTGTAARFAGLGGLSADAAGNIYVNDYGLIRKINTSTQVTSFSPQADVVSTAVDKNGNVYFVTSIGRQVKVVNQQGIVSIVAGNWALDGYDDGDQYTARFTNKCTLAVDAAGNIYVADQHRVRKITIK